jgi:diadenylate cyclase
LNKLFQIGSLQFGWIDILDLVLAFALIVQLFRMMQGSVSIRVLAGVIALYIIFLIVKFAELKVLSSIIGGFVEIGFLAILILFQQEIRKFLLLIGRTATLNNSDIKLPWKKEFIAKNLQITPIVEASKILAGTNTGALIVFAKSSDMKFYEESGDDIDAVVSKRLLISIFNKNSPLHDGAVIINKGRIKAARCILPVSENDAIPAAFGLRHRAAIGITEITDSIVLIVSEERGQISLAVNGKIDHNLTPQELRNKLNTYLEAGPENFNIARKVKEKVKEKVNEIK